MLRRMAIFSVPFVFMYTASAHAMKVIIVVLLAMGSSSSPEPQRPSGEKFYEVRDSVIDGQGLFAKRVFEEGEEIGVGISTNAAGHPEVTRSLGAWINHSAEPNAAVKSNDGKEWFVVPLRQIKENEEITVNYGDAPWFIQGPESYWNS
ncbi:MAG TPA: SET domain-containing protein-lysine N-methyltransferase [Myxococcota bacterium]|nr:SET domain-containing protein-lysine N-methyltransferase [Myxococcota bacterium]